MTAARLVDEIAELPIETRYPEGFWRVPIEMALQCSSSAYVDQIRKRQAGGEYPFTDCGVFIREGRFFAVIDWPRRDANSCLKLVIALDLWPWENRDAFRPRFGLREDPS